MENDNLKNTGAENFSGIPKEEKSIMPKVKAPKDDNRSDTLPEVDQPKFNSTIDVGEISSIPNLKFRNESYEDSIYRLAQESTQEYDSYKNNVQKGQQDRDKLTRAIGRKSERREDLAQDYGLRDDEAYLDDLVSQIKFTNRNAQADVLEEENNGEGRSQTRRGTTKSQNRVNRNAAIQTLRLSASADVVSGKIQTATRKLEQAIESEFAPIEHELQIKLQNIQDNKEFMSASQREKASATERVLGAKLQKVNDQKAQKKEVQGIANRLWENGAPPQMIAEVIKKDDLDGVRNIPGASDFLKSEEDKLNIKLKNAQIYGQHLANKERKQKMNAQQQAKELGLLSQEQLKIADGLRKELEGNQYYKDAYNLEDSTKSLLIALNQKDGVSDISAINSFQRLVVDPGVAVREGDVALLQSAQSYKDKTWLKAQGLMKGDKLTDEGRRQMQDITSKVYQVRINAVNDRTSRIRNSANDYGLDYDRYVGNSFADINQINEEVARYKPTEETEVVESESLIYGNDGLNFITNTLNANSTVNSSISGFLNK